MPSTTDKIVDDITYERDYLARHCHNCAAFLAPSRVCATLVQDDCSSSYTFSIKDIIKQSYSNGNSPIPNEGEGHVPPKPIPIQKASEPSQGVKFDEGKTLYSLVPPYALEAVAKNLTAGLKKYPARNNWMQVEKAEERYLDALYRHLESHRKGEIYDTDNIDPSTTHLSAVAVNSLFLLELMLNPELNKEKELD